ncbi:MAG: DUF2993 domain-containing protein [Actinomycetaceae bacterium]|nr:DUF2993 domain-containing protein [Actinomycetaceae bacterium]MDU0971187.1 DUF2993 domain-containing protein [Actinomycetaceae bacterium]
MTHFKRLAIVLVVIFLLGGVLDRALWWLTEDMGTSSLADHGITNPSFHVHSIPYLTQLASQQLKDVEISGDRWARNDSAVDDVVIRAHGVHLDLAKRDVTSADDLDVTAVIPLDELEKSLNRRATSGVTKLTVENNQLVATTRANSFEIRSIIKLAPGGITTDGKAALNLQFTNIQFSDPFAQQLLGSNFSLPTVTLPLGSLPSHMTLSSIAIKPHGIAVGMTGKNVPLGN